MISRRGSPARLAGAVFVLLMGGGIAIGQGVITEIKSPPLKASDIFEAPGAFHPGGPAPPWGGWAGARIKVHILDDTEIDGGSYMPGPMTPPPPFAATFAGASMPVFRTFLHPSWPNSGIDITQSVNQPIGTLKFHVAGSDPRGNSDVDATLMIWAIYHVRPNQGSEFIELPGSAYILVRSDIPDTIGQPTPSSPFFDQFHIQGNPATNPLASRYQLPPPIEPGPEAHWAHLLNPITFHIPAGHPGSNLIAIFTNTATIGIEHVPEPAAAVLAGAGAASLLVGWVMRRRRIHAG